MKPLYMYICYEMSLYGIPISKKKARFRTVYVECSNLYKKRGYLYPSICLYSSLLIVVFSSSFLWKRRTLAVRVWDEKKNLNVLKSHT